MPAFHVSARHLFAAAVAAICFAVPALAQTPGSRIAIESSSPSSQDDPVRIQTSIHFNLPGPAGDTGDGMMQLRDRARRIVEEMTGAGDAPA